MIGMELTAGILVAALENLPLVATEAAGAPPADALEALWQVAKDATPPVALVLVVGIYYINSINKGLQTKNDALQAKHDLLLEKFITMATEGNATIKEVRSLFASLMRGRPGGSANDRPE